MQTERNLLTYPGDARGGALPRARRRLSFHAPHSHATCVPPAHAEVTIGCHRLMRTGRPPGGGAGTGANAASVNVLETCPKSVYTDYVNLLTIGPEWRIVSKIYASRGR